MHIASVGCALPDHRYDQETLIAAFEGLWQQRHFNTDRVRQLQEAVLVGGRNLALPLDEYAQLTTFGIANQAFLRVGAKVGEKAIRQALEPLSMAPHDIDAILFATVTGVTTPSLDARLVNCMGLRSDVKRLPIFGLGCVAGAAGTARMYDYLRAWPDQIALLLCVELCSLTLQKDDLSIPNLVASGLFGDGAAAVLGAGDERARRLGLTGGVKVRATRSVFYPDTEDILGWDIGESGFKIVLAATLPEVVEQHIGTDVDAFLREQELTRQDIRFWVCHAGGPKVIEAFQRALGITADDLRLTWRSLRDVGNLSSASVLFVLRDTLGEAPPPPGSYGLMVAMGPGFCTEMVLLQW